MFYAAWLTQSDKKLSMVNKRISSKPTYQLLKGSISAYFIHKNITFPEMMILWAKYQMDCLKQIQASKINFHKLNQKLSKV